MSLKTTLYLWVNLNFDNNITCDDDSRYQIESFPPALKIRR